MDDLVFKPYDRRAGIEVVAAVSGSNRRFRGTDGRVHIAGPTDYLVRYDRTGAIAVMSAEVFESQFAPIDGDEVSGTEVIGEPIDPPAPAPDPAPTSDEGEAVDVVSDDVGNVMDVL